MEAAQKFLGWVAAIMQNVAEILLGYADFLGGGFLRAVLFNELREMRQQLLFIHNSSIA